MCTDCSYCKNDGLCSRKDSNKDQWNHVCLYPECSFDSLCQFSSENYFITLDILIGTKMKTGNALFNQQSTIIHLTLMFLIIILVFCLIFKEKNYTCAQVNIYLL